ncbi:MAG: toll/interleukin-1 receptor domain-containing protein [Armatimonadota bacterium]
MLIWLFVGTVCWWAYEQKFGQLAGVFPELGMCQQTQYGNTVLRSEVWPGYVRVMFSPVPAGSRLGGGVIWSNIYSANGIASDFPVSEGSVVYLKVRGKRGGEKFELKLKNKRGEGWCIIGDSKYPITTEFKVLEIPLDEFEQANQSSMGVAFNRSGGLNAVILGVGSDLNNPDMAELHIASLHITNRVKRDWITYILLIAVMFFGTAAGRLLYILNTHFNVFISYSSKDTGIATELSSELKRCGIITWLAPSDLQPGVYFPMQIAVGIRLCRYFLLIASPNSSASQFVGFEIGMRVGKQRWYLFGLDFFFGLGGLDKRNIFVVELGNPEENVPVVFQGIQTISLDKFTYATTAKTIASKIHSGRY